jgi:hypothetical protein
VSLVEAVPAFSGMKPIERGQGPGPAANVQNLALVLQYRKFDPLSYCHNNVSPRKANRKDHSDGIDARDHCMREAGYFGYETKAHLGTCCA